MSISKEKIAEIKKSMDKSCRNCQHFEEAYSEYESMYTYPARCDREGRQFVSNLKSFPFQKEQKCFSPNYYYLVSIDPELFELYSQLDFDGSDEVIQEKIDQIIAERYPSN